MNAPARGLVRAYALAIALVIACAILGAVFAPSVEAHEVRVTVACDASGIQVHGIKFAEELPKLVTVTGPDGYSSSFTVTTDEWAHTFPLGPNGAYRIDWPDAGPFAQDFTVDCAEPTPEPTPRRTPTTGGFPPPTPHATLPPTDTETAATGGLGLVVALGVIFAFSVGYVLGAVVATRPRR